MATYKDESFFSRLWNNYVNDLDAEDIKEDKNLTDKM